MILTILGVINSNLSYVLLRYAFNKFKANIKHTQERKISFSKQPVFPENYISGRNNKMHGNVEIKSISSNLSWVNFSASGYLNSFKGTQRYFIGCTSFSAFGMSLGCVKKVFYSGIFTQLKFEILWIFSVWQIHQEYIGYI